MMEDENEPNTAGAGGNRVTRSRVNLFKAMEGETSLVDPPATHAGHL